MNALHTHPPSKRGKRLVISIIAIALILAASAWVYRSRNIKPRPATLLSESN